MAIRAQYPQVLKPVVAFITINMVKFDRHTPVYRYPGPTADFTLWRLYTGEEKFGFKLIALHIDVFR